MTRSLADTFVMDAQHAVEQRGAFYVALAGGSTPRPAYKLLAEEPRIEEIAWKDVHVYFSDERCVPPQDDESNYKMACEALLSAVNIPSANINRMKGEEDPQNAAREYTQVLRGDLGESSCLDLIILGMGSEGHTASLFPGYAANGDRLVDAPFVEKFGSYRLTMTPRLINAARHVVIVTTGNEKAHALAAARTGTYDPNIYPIQLIEPLEGRLTWLVDRAAAAQM
ncbi:MAG: 6-phosphogluconolactonase [Candidatus Eremiobacteraeota bacterium]|nr:6-phosphogluconolactonase [Candidatus Eremiobacteraeota bacterium]